MANLARVPAKQLGFTSPSKVFDCDSILVVGDNVYIDSTTDNKVLKASNNNPPYPVIGRIIKKPTLVTAEVLFFGIISSGVSWRGPVYLSASGGISSIKLSSGYVQLLGFGWGTGDWFFRPSFNRIKRA